MIDIEPEAEKFIADLFKQQDEKNLGLKIDIESAGSPMATINFNFCLSQDLPNNYKIFSYNGFDVYVDNKDLPYLEDSKVNMPNSGADKKLTITAPNAKGKPPAEDAPLKTKIAYSISSEISPQLASHGGFVEVVEITDDLIVVLNFGGGCQGCSSVKATLKNGVEAQLKAKYPEIKEVRDVTDHTQIENSYYK